MRFSCGRSNTIGFASESDSIRRRRDRRRDRRDVLRRIPRRGRCTGHARRTRRPCLGRVWRELGRRPASVRPGPGGALPRDAGHVPRSVERRRRVPDGCRGGRPDLPVGRRSRRPAGRSRVRRLVPEPRPHGRRGVRPACHRAGRRPGPVGLSHRDRLPGRTRGVDVCLRDDRRAWRRPCADGPNRFARAAWGDRRRGRRRRRTDCEPTRSWSRPVRRHRGSSTRLAPGIPSASDGASSSRPSCRRDRPTSSRKPRSAPRSGRGPHRPAVSRTWSTSACARSTGSRRSARPSSPGGRIRRRGSNGSWPTPARSCPPSPMRRSAATARAPARRVSTAVRSSDGVPGAPGLFICAGHGAWGISTGPASARLIVDEILGRSPTIAPELDPGRFGVPRLPG